MDPSMLLHAVMATWLLISSPSETRAYRPADDLPTIEQPRSASFRMEGRFVAGPESATVTGGGAFVSPDRVQMSLDATASGRTEHAEIVVIGTAVYTRQGANGRWQRSEYPANRPAPYPGAAGPLDPRVAEILAGFQMVGAESVAGVPSDRYHGEVNLLTAGRSIPDLDPSLLGLFKSFGLALDLWVGRADRYLHRLKIGIDIGWYEPRADQPDHASGDLDMTLFGFDQPIVIGAPSGQTPLTPPLAPPVQAPAQLPGGRR